MALQRSIQGKRAKAVFFRQVNDIDVYTEDSSKVTKKLYGEMLSRAFKGTYRINTVFPLGDKHTVINDCEKYQANMGERLRLYVVDGDLDLLYGSTKSGLKRLYVINRYCIENYLIDKKAIEVVLHEEDLEKNFDEIEKEFDFNNWVKSNTDILFELFILYAVAYKNSINCETISYSINRLVSSGDGIIDCSKVHERSTKIKEMLLDKISEDELGVQIELVRKHAELYRDSKMRFISGKDYLLPLALMRMRKITKFRAENDVIKLRLAMKCDVAELEEAVHCLE